MMIQAVSPFRNMSALKASQTAVHAEFTGNHALQANPKFGMLVFARRKNEEILIGNWWVRVTNVGLHTVTLDIVAPGNVPVFYKSNKNTSVPEVDKKLKDDTTLYHREPMTLKVNESIGMGDSITLTLTGFQGTKARIGTTAPRNVRVDRAEIHDAA
jgi:carbon storage regulator